MEMGYILIFKMPELKIPSLFPPSSSSQTLPPSANNSSGTEDTHPTLPKRDIFSLPAKSGPCSSQSMSNTSKKKTAVLAIWKCGIP